MKQLKVLGVCQGQGTLLFPFKRNLLGNIEPRGCFHTPSEEQWKLNFGDIPFFRKYLGEADKTSSGKEMHQLISQADIIIGSPNCGTSSILSYSRKKSLGKPKEDETIKMFLDIVTRYRPSIFVMENLPKLLDFMPQDEWVKSFQDYDLLFLNHSVGDFGNSQLSRVRLLIVAIKKGSNLAKINQFKKVFKVRKSRVTSELLQSKRLEPKYWPMNGNMREENLHKVCMYDYRDGDKTKLNLAQIRELWVRDFKDCYKWPINSEKMKTLPGVYRNHPGRYPMTARKQDRQFRPDGIIHSPGELAVIQGLPIRFKLYMVGREDPKLKYWINKGRVAVTKGPTYEMGIWFKNCLLKR